MPQPLFDGTLESHKPSESISPINEFLAMIGHELRTPISAILGWAELLDKEQIDQTDFDKLCEVIRHNALVQVQLLDELADYSRLGANTLALTIRVVSLAQIIQAAVETLAPMARKKQIHVDAQCGLSQAEVDGDPTRLLQVFSNLFSNAIKFTPSGGNVRVTLESSGDYHTVTVSDTGEGISAEFLPFVFDRYRQADRTASGRGNSASHSRTSRRDNQSRKCGKRGRIGIHHSTSAQGQPTERAALMALVLTTVSTN